MSGAIDDRTAWELLRALRRDPAGARSRATLDGRPELWLEVEPEGGWRASRRVTDGGGKLIDLYLPIVRVPEVVIGQLGQSLDGRIATESGASHFVTGPEDLDRLHRLRALVDAVVVGAGTVASDDPQLTVRRVEGEDPVRVVLDPEGRLDPGSRVFTDEAASTLVVHGASSRSERRTGNAAVVHVPLAKSGDLDLVTLLQLLRERGLRRVLVEGGGVTVSRFLRDELLDRLHITVAPVLIGSGRPSITLEPVVTLDAALRPPCRHFRLGQDVLFDLDLRSGPS